jgi:hypothetical protein
MLLYICMTSPDLEKAARDYSLMFISREYSNEEDKIERSSTSEELFEILKCDPDVVNHPKLIEKILENPAPVISMIIEEIKYTHSDLFIETSLKILFRSNIDCSNELIGLIRAPVKCAYALSAVSVLLGMIGSKNAIKPVWDCYNYLKEHHHERHEQGPLIGLYELKKKGIISRISSQISGH